MEKGSKKKTKVQIIFVPVAGDPLEAIINAIEPNISSVLAKHGASIKIGVKEFLRNHAKE